MEKNQDKKMTSFDLMRDITDRTVTLVCTKAP
jgi:hypothetical protein